MKKEFKELEKKFGKKIIFNETLSKYSWFNLGGPANILFKPDTEDQIINFFVNFSSSSKLTQLPCQL